MGASGTRVLRIHAQQDRAVSRVDENTIVLESGDQYSFTCTLFAGVQLIAQNQGVLCAKEMMSVRDNGLAAADTDAEQLLRELPKKLGQVEQLIPELGTSLLEQLVPPNQIMVHRNQFDADVLLSVLSFAANNAMGFFQSELMRIFPDACVIGKFNRSDEPRLPRAHNAVTRGLHARATVRELALLSALYSRQIRSILTLSC